MASKANEEFGRSADSGEGDEHAHKDPGAGPLEVTAEATQQKFLESLEKLGDQELLVTLEGLGDSVVTPFVEKVCGTPVPQYEGVDGALLQLDRLLNVADRICACVWWLFLQEGTKGAGSYPGVQILLGFLPTLEGGARTVPVAPHVTLLDWEERLRDLGSLLKAGPRVIGRAACDRWRQEYASAISRVRAVRSLLTPPPAPYQHGAAGTEAWQFAEQLGPWWAPFNEYDPNTPDPGDNIQEAGSTAASAPGIPQGVSQAEPPELSETAWKLVELLKAAGAFAQPRRKTRSELAKMLDGNRDPLHTAQELARPSAVLKKKGYTQSEAGPKGGIWLTEMGQNLPTSQLLRPDQLQKATTKM